jgi:hypothetical protein
MRQSPLPAAPDAVHALLPLVSNEGKEAMEIARQQAQLPCLQVGHREGVLELLRLVPGTGRSEVTNGRPVHSA